MSADEKRSFHDLCRALDEASRRELVEVQYAPSKVSVVFPKTMRTTTQLQLIAYIRHHYDVTLYHYKLDDTLVIVSPK